MLVGAQTGAGAGNAPTLVRSHSEYFKVHMFPQNICHKERSVNQTQYESEIERDGENEKKNLLVSIQKIKCTSSVGILLRPVSLMELCVLMLVL